MSATITSTDAPAWEKKLRGMVRLHATCHEEGDHKKFFEAYPVHPSLSKRSLRGFQSEPITLSASSGLDALTTAEKDTLKASGNDTTSKHEAVKNKIDGLTEELKDDPNPNKDSWKDKIKKAGEEAKEKLNKIIDDNTDAIINKIRQMPEDKRDAAVDFWGTILSGFLDFWTGIWEQILNVINAIVDWVINMWEDIKTAFKKAAGIFVDAYNWIKNLF